MSLLLEYDSSFVYSLNKILLQLNIPQFIRIYDHSNLVLKVKGFSAAIHAINVLSQKMRLTVSAATKLDRLYSSISCFAIIFG